MDMTVEEITMKIIIETTRIMHERGAIPAPHDGSWKDRRKYVCKMLRSKIGSEEIINFLETLIPKKETGANKDLTEYEEFVDLDAEEDEEAEIIQEQTGFSAANRKKETYMRMPQDLRKYTLEYLRSIPKLIRYRIEAGSMDIDEKTERKIEELVDRQIDKEIERVAGNLKREKGSKTILNYRVYEERFDKDPEKVRRFFKEVKGMDVEASEIDLETPADLKEKNYYMNHRIWTKSPLMPIIKIEKKEGV